MWLSNNCWHTTATTFFEWKSKNTDFVLLGSSEEHLKCVKPLTPLWKYTHNTLDKWHHTVVLASVYFRACVRANVYECGCKQASALLLRAPGLQIILRLLQNTLQNFCLLSKLITLVGQIKQGTLNATQTWREWSAGGRRVCVQVCVPERKQMCLCVN